MEKNEFQKVANKVSIVTIIGNIILSVMKLLAGVIAHSNAMISDAIHSASDVFSTFIVMIGIKLSSKSADKEHPYGHERLECVAAIVLSIVLFIASLVIFVFIIKAAYDIFKDAVLASTSGSTGSAATIICSEGLLQSDASYIAVIADSTAK